MKSLTLLTLLCLLASPVRAVVVTTTFTNLDGASGEETNVVYDNSGTLLALNTGYVGIGTFLISNASIASISTAGGLETAFTQFGTASDFNIVSGAFSDSTSDNVNTPFTYTGNNVYIVIGNAASIATSTEFLVWDSGVAFFDTAPNGGPSDVLLDVGAIGSELVIGRDDLYTFDHSGDGGSATEAAFSTSALIPEPSSTAMLGLGGMMLLLRRRK